MADLPTGTVTFLFTDVEGSTRLWEEHPEAMKAALARHDEILRDAVASHGGQVVKQTGDGLHAAFAIADSAVAAAIGAQHELALHPWLDTAPLRVRMGLHTGTADLREGDYYGTALNRAARLMAAAHGGQVVVSNATEELIRDALPAGVELTDLGAHRLRDLARPDRVFQVSLRGLPHAFPPLRSLDAFPGNLPVQLTSFVGRDQDLKTLADALRSSRLVTLTGVGGVGKTRLAIQSAADLLPEFPDGAWLCELAGAEDPESMIQLVAATLSLQPQPGLSLDEGIVELLRSKQLLLVLDNCEHLLEAAGRLAERVLAGCGHVRVLATSREGLGVAGEQLWPLRSLPVPRDQSETHVAASDAAHLFEERARAGRPGFSIDADNAAAVTEICRRLDGIPLALELAAARVVAMSPREIATRLDERFRLLTGGRRTAVERHHTLRATVDWSYSLLDEQNRLVFDRLGVFVSGFDAEAAGAVVAGEAVEAWDVLDALGDLTAKSMVVPEEFESETTRYQLLETLRQYARERLDDAGDADTWRRRHASYYAELAERIGPALRGPDELAWRARLAVELDNLRAAVTWGLDSQETADRELALRIIAALAIQASYDPAAGIGAWAEAALAVVDATSPGRRYDVRSAAAYNSLSRGELERGVELATLALRDGVPDGACWPVLADTTLAYAAGTSGHFTEAANRLQDALQRLADRMDPVERMTMHSAGAGWAMSAGDVEGAIALADEGREIAERSRNPSAVASALYVFGYVRSTTEPEVAVTALEECLELTRQGATPVVYGYAQTHLARVRAWLGDRPGALDSLRQAMRYGIDIGHRAMVEQAVRESVVVLAKLGEPELVVTMCGCADSDALQVLGAGPHTDLSASAADQARNALDARAYDALYARGAAMSYDEVVDFALAELDRLIAEADDG